MVTLYYDPEAPEKMYVEGDKSVLGARRCTQASAWHCWC